MGKKVFANGREICGKASDIQCLAAMPDVCLTPPPPPAGPLPIPYPNFSNAGDTDGGSPTVKIGGEEVSQRENPTSRQAKGDEAATKGQGMGLASHSIQGKTSAGAWSFDVKFDGQNVSRHSDISKHNHQ